MEFTIKNNDSNQYSIDTSKYIVPVDGYYCVSCPIVRYVPTGEFEKVLNRTKWEFWKLWKPKYTTRPMYKIVEFNDGSEMKYFKKDEIVNSPRQIYRIT